MLASSSPAATARPIILCASCGLVANVPDFYVAARAAAQRHEGHGGYHMRFSTDDGRFGLVVSPRPGRSMFTFQLVIDGQVIGDDEPAILGSLMKELQHRPSFNADQLPDARSSPASTVETLLADEQYESAMLRGAESLDRWLVWLYTQQAHVIALAQAVDGNDRTGPILISVIEATDLRPLLDAVVRYWTEANAFPQQGTDDSSSARSRHSIAPKSARWTEPSTTTNKTAKTNDL